MPKRGLTSVPVCFISRHSCGYAVLLCPEDRVFLEQVRFILPMAR